MKHGGNSSVEAWENSSVEAWENSSVEAWGNSSVVARENSSVVAWGNVQVLDRLNTSGSVRIKMSGNARIVYNPKTIHEFMDFYGIKHDKQKATFYKAVHKNTTGEYVSDHDGDFKYVIKENAYENCDNDINEDCGSGIHISHLDWALNYGRGWRDLAIIELEVEIDNIILPKYSDGKVRTPACMVLREVPLNDCGVMGRIIAKRLKREV